MPLSPAHFKCAGTLLVVCLLWNPGLCYKHTHSLRPSYPLLPAGAEIPSDSAPRCLTLCRPYVSLPQLSLGVQCIVSCSRRSPTQPRSLQERGSQAFGSKSRRRPRQNLRVQGFSRSGLSHLHGFSKLLSYIFPFKIPSARPPSCVR